MLWLHKIKGNNNRE